MDATCSECAELLEGKALRCPACGALVRRGPQYAAHAPEPREDDVERVAADLLAALVAGEADRVPHPPPKWRSADKTAVELDPIIVLTDEVAHTDDVLPASEKSHRGWLRR